MVRKEFNSVWDTMCTYFSYKNAEREDIKSDYFEQLKYYDPIEWQDIYAKIKTKYEFMPKISTIVEIANEVRNEKRETKALNIPVCECKLCQGTGYRSIYEISNGKKYEYVVACDCPNGDDKLYDGRIIKDKKHRSNYIIPRFSQVIPGGANA